MSLRNRIDKLEANRPPQPSAPRLSPDEVRARAAILRAQGKLVLTKPHALTGPQIVVITSLSV